MQRLDVAGKDFEVVPHDEGDYVHVDDVKELQAQRDELLAACKMAAASMSLTHGCNGPAEHGAEEVERSKGGGMAAAYLKIRKAIARAES